MLNIITIGIIIILILIFTMNSKECDDRKSIIQILIRQSARWALAAEQDRNLIVSVLHANYAAGYLWALKDFADSAEMEQITGIDMKKFEEKIKLIQDATTIKLSKSCPQFVGDHDKFLAAIAGEG